MDDTISRQAAIETAENVAYAVDEHGSAEGWLAMLVNSLEVLPSALLTREEFENELHDMFGHIWDCEIDHPIFQDTVGDIMEAVILLVYNNYTGKKGEQKWKG